MVASAYSEVVVEVVVVTLWSDLSISGICRVVVLPVDVHKAGNTT